MKTRFPLILVILLLAPGAVGVQAAPSFISSFNPNNIGDLVGIGFDPASGNVFVYPSFGASIHEFTPAGVQVNTIPRPGATSDDFDLDVSRSPVNIGGTVVPANTLLVINGDDLGSERLYGLNKNTGAILAAVNLPTTSTVGGSYSDARGTLFAVNHDSNLIQEVNLATGASLNGNGLPFARPAFPFGNPGFDVFFGDVEVSAGNGNLFIVGNSTNLIRELTPTGAFVQDIDVGPLGVSRMSGIALNDAAGEAWISDFNGNIYRLGGFPISTTGGDGGGGAVPEPATVLLLGSGLAGLVAWRRWKQV